MFKGLSKIVDWLGQQLDRIKTIAIVVLVILVGLAFIQNGCQREDMYELANKITGLDVENDVLTRINNNLEETVDSIALENERLKEKIKDIDKQRQAVQDQLEKVKENRDSLLIAMMNMPTDEKYEFLTEVAYPYDGPLEYPFNEPQVNNIYHTFQDKQFLEFENELLQNDIEGCNQQLAMTDSIKANMSKSMSVLRSQTARKDTIISNQEEIRKYTEEEVQKLRRKLLFWKIGTGVATVGLIIIAL